MLAFAGAAGAALFLAQVGKGFFAASVSQRGGKYLVVGHAAAALAVGLPQADARKQRGAVSDTKPEY